MTQLTCVACSLLFWGALSVSAQTTDPDPFAGLTATPNSDAAARRSFLARLFRDNAGFREELMSEFTTDADGSNASRQSVGFEALKKFSTDTSTVAAFDFQGRFVRRDGYNSVPNDMEGATRPGWAFEYHNLYLDLYHLAGKPGRINARIGHSYVPFGLNLQTDTHGTLLQLSNGDNFGYDRDWYAGLWGALNRHLNYDAGYLTGSGYGLHFRGQTGLAAFRLSLSNHYSSQYGLEAGLSALAGERLTDASQPLRTQRFGADARYRHTAPRGLLTFTTELSGGRDARNRVLTNLQQAEYLRASRRWGVATQFRQFSRETPSLETMGTTASLIAEFSWYFRNDVAGSNSHWIKLNVERQLTSAIAPTRTILTLQYYFYR